MEEAVRMDSVTMEGPGDDTKLPDLFPVWLAFDDAAGAEVLPHKAGVCVNGERPGT